MHAKKYRRLFGMLQKMGWQEADMRAYMKQRWGVSSLKNLTAAQYESFCYRLERMTWDDPNCPAPWQPAEGSDLVASARETLAAIQEGLGSKLIDLDLKECLFEMTDAFRRRAPRQALSRTRIVAEARYWAQQSNKRLERAIENYGGGGLEGLRNAIEEQRGVESSIVASG